MTAQENAPTTPDNLDPVAPATAAENDVKGLSQGAIVRKRFRGHTGAMVSVILLALVLLLALTSLGIGPIPGGGSTATSTLRRCRTVGAPRSRCSRSRSVSTRSVRTPSGGTTSP